jgi:hypothetical protein
MGFPTPEDLLEPFETCLKNNAAHAFPEIGKPGISPILLGAVGAMLGPANQVIKLIPPVLVPPDESIKYVKTAKDLLTNIPSIVLKGFTDAAKGLPKITVEIAGVKQTIGEVDLPPEAFKPDAITGLVTGLITAPISIFTDILKKLISLNPTFLPTIDVVKEAIKAAIIAAVPAIPPPVAEKFAGCLSNSFMEVIKGLAP